MGLTLQIEKPSWALTITSLLTLLLGKVIKIKLITSFWVCPQVSHDMLSMDGVRGGCWFTISKFQKFPVAIPTREFLKKHTLWSFHKYRDKFENPNTYLSLQKHKESSKTTQTNISMLFLQLLNREIVIISPTNCQTNYLIFATFQRGKKNFKLVWGGLPENQEKKRKRLTSFFPITFAKLSDRWSPREGHYQNNKGPTWSKVKHNMTPPGRYVA